MKADGQRMRITRTGWTGALFAACVFAGEVQAQIPEADLCRSGGLGKGRGWVTATAVDASVPDPDPIGGMGGTGSRPGDDGPVAGTIYGTVTRFGSICVNGVEVSLPPDMPVRIDDKPIAQSAIGLGQVVRVDVRYEGRRARGEAVTVMPVVSGPVTERDPVAQRFTVMGRTVRLGVESIVALSGTSIPEVGTQVAVSGLLAPDGAVVATRLESMPEGDAARVAGIVRDMDGQYVDVEGVTVKLPKESTPAGLRVGESVSASGTWSEGTLLASRLVRSQAVPLDGREGGWLSLEGYLVPCGNGPGLYALGGVVVDGRTIADLAPLSGRRVVALGTLNAQGTLRLHGLGVSSLDDRLLDPDAPVPVAEPVTCE